MIIWLEPCDRACHGQSCYNCCGEAPGMHFVSVSGTLWTPWDKECCSRCKGKGPDGCMYLQGKTREQWMEEVFD